MQLVAELPIKKGEYIIAMETINNKCLVVTQTEAFFVDMDTKQITKVIK